MITVLIIDDHEIIREAVTEVLRKTPGVEVIGSFSSPAQYLADRYARVADIAVVDFMLPGKTGIELSTQLLNEHRVRHAIILTQYVKKDIVQKAATAGIQAVVAKETAVDTLRDAIHAVIQHRYYLCPLFLSLIYRSLADTKDYAQNHPTTLTKRERTILQHLISGASRTNIANELFISPSTVTTHRRRIMSKLNVHSTAELVQAAMHLGITT